MHMRSVHPDMDTHTTCRTIDPAPLQEAKESMARVKTELGIIKNKPDEMGDAVDWLEYAIDTIKYYDPDQFDDKNWIVERLQRVRDEAWDAIVDGRLEAMHRDATDELTDR